MTTFEQQLTQEQNNQAKRDKRGFILLLVFALIVGITSTLILGRALLVNDSLAEPMIGLSSSLLLLVAAIFIKRGWNARGIGLATLIVFSLDIYLISKFTDVGLVLTLVCASSMALIASQSAPRKYAPRAITVIVSASMLIIIADLYWPNSRIVISPPDLRIIYIGAAIVLLITLLILAIEFPRYTLRGKLISVSVLLLITAVSITIWMVSGIARNALVSHLDEDMARIGESAAGASSELLSQQIRVLEALSLDSSLRGLVRSQNVEYTDEASALTEIEQIDVLWADNAMRSTLAVPILSNAASRTLATFQHIFPDHLNVMVTDKYGGVAGATYTPIQFDQSGTEWWQAAYNDGNGGTYIGQPTYDPALDELVIPIALPIYTADTNGVVGVLRTSYALSPLETLIEDFGGEGGLRVLFADQVVVPGRELGEFILQSPSFGAYNLERLQTAPYEILTIIVDDTERLFMLAPIVTDGAFPILDQLGWGVVVQQGTADAFEAVDTLQRASVIMGILVVAVGGIVTAYVAGWITKPINDLTETAVAIASGDINRHAEIETQDEIGTLAVAFNSMTSQLRDFISSLEERVANRTHALATSSDVSRSLSTIISIEALINEVVHQMHDAFGYYHAQLFLLDEDGENLVLRGGSGDVGQTMMAAGHALPMGRGLVGRAAQENRTILINDVSQDDGWLYNPDLPNTQCEISVPISIGEQIMGVLDIQHDVVNSFNDDTVDLLQSIVRQTALAIQNVRTFERAERQQAKLTETLRVSELQSRNLSLLNEFSAALTVATNLDDVYRIAKNHILELMDADRTSIMLSNASGAEIEVMLAGGSDGIISKGDVLPLANTVAERAISENRLIRLPDEQPLTDFVDSVRWKSHGIKSLLSIPLSVGVSAFGVVNIGSVRKNVFQDTEVSFALQIANLIAVTIESQRLAEEARLLASIVENHPDFISVGTMGGHAVYINPSGLAMMGLPADYDISHMDSSDFYAPEDVSRLMNIGLPIAMEEGQWSRETALIGENGVLIPVEETVGINYDPGGNTVGFSITMRDITDRNAAAEALRQSEQSARNFQNKLTRLHHISTELGGLATLDDIYRQAIELGRSELGFDRLGLWLFDADASVMFGTYGVDVDGTLQDENKEQEPIPIAGSWIEPLLRSGERRQVNSYAELYYAGQPVGHGWNILTVLYDGDHPIGWLAADNLLNQQEMQLYEPELMILFTNLLTNVIVNKRAANISAKQAHELQIVTEISRAAAGLTARDALLQFMADEVKAKFNLYHVQIFMLHEPTGMLILTAVSDQESHPPVETVSHTSVEEQVCLVSKAAKQHKALFANDVSLQSNYVVMDDLPDTRSVLAVPLIVGQGLLGVINMHADTLNHFTETDINVQMTLAAQIAAALRNVEQYQEAQEALAELTQLQQMVSRKNWKAFMTDQSRTVQGYLFDPHTVQVIEPDGTDNVVQVGEFVGRETAVVSPLIVQGVTIGGLAARDSSGAPLNEDQQELLTAAAQQIADALERARLLEVTELGRQNLDLRASELALLNEISKIVSAQLDLDSLFNTAAPPIQSAFEATSIFFALYDADTKMIAFPYYRGESGSIATVPPRHADEDGGFTARIILSQKPFIFNKAGASSDDYFAQGGRLDDTHARALNSFLGVPMIVGDTLIGAIGIGAHHGNEERVYNEEDQRLLSTLASTVGVAVQNVRQFENTQRRARREQMLREIYDQINAAVDAESILRATSEAVSQAIGLEAFAYLEMPEQPSESFNE